MIRFEYKHVHWKMSWKLGLSLPFSHYEWERALMTILTQHGNEGWELKSVIYEFGLHYHLVFARRSDKPVNWTPDHCRCGYNMTGNVSGVCPECGEKMRIDPDNPIDPDCDD